MPHQVMPEIRVAIYYKGRTLTEFLMEFATQLFPDKKEMLLEGIPVFVGDKKRIERLETESGKYPSAKEVEEELEAICRNSELKSLFRVERDTSRANSPYRMVLQDFGGLVGNTNVLFYGAKHPIEEVVDGHAHVAIATGDRLVAKYAIFLAQDPRPETDPQSMLNLLPQGRSMNYEGQLHIAAARHMIWYNHRPSDLAINGRGFPFFPKQQLIFVQGPYHNMYERIMGGELTYQNTPDVEAAVLSDLENQCIGIGIMSSGGTFMKAVANITPEERKGDVCVFNKPVIESTGIVLRSSIPGTDQLVRDVVGAILEINRAVRPNPDTTYEAMRAKLGNYIVPPNGYN